MTNDMDEVIEKDCDGDLNITPEMLNHPQISSSGHYTEVLSQSRENYYRLPVEDRNILWNAAREHKLESIRQMTTDNDLDECTFKPNLVSTRQSRQMRRNTIKNDSNILESSSVQKYVSRMNKARELKFMKEHENDLKPGSGNIWENKLTVPREPRLRVCSAVRNKSTNKLSMSMSKMVSIQDLYLHDESSHDEYENPSNFLNDRHRRMNRHECMQHIRDGLQEIDTNEHDMEIRPLEHTKNLTMTTSSINEKDKEILLQGELLKKYDSNFHSPDIQYQAYDFRSFGIESMNFKKANCSSDKENSSSYNCSMVYSRKHSKKMDSKDQATSPGIPEMMQVPQLDY
jgi:hypothetical protein